jgi:site-specific recombinase
LSAKRGASPWDLTALLNAADPKASLAERHLWIIRFLEWLRHAPVQSEARASAPAELGAAAPAEATPTQALRLRHMLGVIERNAEHRDRVGAMLVAFLREVDSAALLADFGFAPRAGLWAEFGRRVRSRILPLTPATTDLGELFALLFPAGSDAAWLTQLDAETEAHLAALLAPIADDGSDWRAPFLEAIMFLASAIRAAGFSPLLRQRMSPELLVDEPFRQLARAAELIREHAESGEPEAHAQLLRDAQYLRALLDVCRRCAASVHQHLEAHGVSVDVVFEADQLRERTHRIELLLGCVLSERPAKELLRFVAEMVEAAEGRRSIGGLFAEHYSMLARKVAERSADAGDHYITRDAAEYREMLRAAANGDAVLGATTLLKALIGMIALGVFWAGFVNGVNYAASFVLIQLLHFTVATKQPAMTAPALADKLGDVASDAGLARFVDEVACLIRSQAAGIFGNLLAVVPVVLCAQWLARAAFGAPIIGPAQAEYTLASLSLAGPTPIFAALTGVLLFASSLIAGWVENWFVWHRLDSAIAWNPRIVDRVGAARARWWSAFWRRNISGLASNVSLGLLLGLVPAIAAFFSLPIDVRHVTLATGQLAAAVGALGLGVVASAPFWWCVAGIAMIGTLNLGVSFWLAFRVALRSRGIRLADQTRIRRAVGQRLRQRPASFILPPRLVPA